MCRAIDTKNKGIWGVDFFTSFNTPNFFSRVYESYRFIKYIRIKNPYSISELVVPKCVSFLFRLELL